MGLTTSSRGAVRPDLATSQLDGFPQADVAGVAERGAVAVGDGLAQPVRVALDSKITDVKFAQGIRHRAPRQRALARTDRTAGQPALRGLYEYF
jgi:hypothetical protein